MIRDELLTMSNLCDRMRAENLVGPVLKPMQIT
jgi:hypothetical protein